MNFKAVIFDMDGVLIDSELHWIDAEKRFLALHNIPYSDDWSEKATGRSLLETVRILKQEHGLVITEQELLAQQINCSEAIYTDHAQPMPGVEALLQKISSALLKTAIASGSSLQRINMIVNRFQWRSFFDELVSTEHVDYIGKPDPAIYTYAAHILGLQPEQCAVIEDSVNGVKAAKAAGMTCVAIPDQRWSIGDFSLADYRVSSLEDKELYRYLGLT